MAITRLPNGKIELRWSSPADDPAMILSIGREIERIETETDEGAISPIIEGGRLAGLKGRAAAIDRLCEKCVMEEECMRHFLDRTRLNVFIVDGAKVFLTNEEVFQRFGVGEGKVAL